MTSTSSPTDLITYYGNCHCGAVRFTVRSPSLSTHEVGTCNCSICTRNGYLTIYPGPEDFAFTQGKENLAEFCFGSGAVVHLFCKTCGSSVGGAMKKDEKMTMAGCNVRLLHDVQPENLKTKVSHGKDLGEPYTYPEFPDNPFPDSPNEDSSTDSKLVEYPANCQCGTVTYTLRLPSLAENTVNHCNCSICDRNGYLLVYPPVRDVAFHTGYEQLSEYRFGTKNLAHKFCGTCGSSIFIDMTGSGKDRWAMNARMLKDVDPSAFTYTYYPGRERIKPLYTTGKPTTPQSLTLAC